MQSEHVLDNGEVIKMVAHGGSEYGETVELRRRVLRRPLGLDFTREQLASERGSIHLALYKYGRLAACLVLRPEGEYGIQMRQVAVDEGMRGRGLGRRLVRISEKVARESGYKRMFCHARETAVDFYSKMGYEKRGERFEEVTVPHLYMEKALF